jgi:hypothetical protein
MIGGQTLGDARCSGCLIVPSFRKESRTTSQSIVKWTTKITAARVLFFGNNLVTALAMSAQCGRNVTPDDTRRNWLLQRSFIRHSNVSPISRPRQTLKT